MSLREKACLRERVGKREVREGQLKRTCLSLISTDISLLVSHV